MKVPVADVITSRTSSWFSAVLGSNLRVAMVVRTDSRSIGVTVVTVTLLVTAPSNIRDNGNKSCVYMHIE